MKRSFVRFFIHWGVHHIAPLMQRPLRLNLFTFLLQLLYGNCDRTDRATAQVGPVA